MHGALESVACIQSWALGLGNFCGLGSYTASMNLLPQVIRMRRGINKVLGTGLVHSQFLAVVSSVGRKYLFPHFYLAFPCRSK